MAKEKQSMNNFGIGWGTILYCLLMFFLYVGMINDGTNVLAPAAAANCGVEPGTIITMNGYAGMIALPANMRKLPNSPIWMTLPLSSSMQRT